MTANSSGLKNNHTRKLNAGAAKKRPALSNISNHITISSCNSISHSSKLSPGTSKIVGRTFLLAIVMQFPQRLLFCQHPPLSDQAANLFLFNEVMQLYLRSVSFLFLPLAAWTFLHLTEIS
ncbi:hypothetical protein KY290_024566 [Solanum tuberosum]|uniref:Uncharacterized protein n=1 Tax=Solanum tuberosum TaxID=4113 RepID=A0ABQ7UT23_SOLTU|nr:hypothetical protein KY284_023419 [Solanum tuberosum]KAH0754296.1 hypothetical protein KY290_024566 [Solanum tuberosum]